VFIRISVGEAADRWTILKLKKERIQDERKAAKAQEQFDNLSEMLSSELGSGWRLGACDGEDDHIDSLGDVNATLWDLENEVRENPTLETYKAISELNDVRAELKAAIDKAFADDDLSEVKEHRSEQ